MIILFAGPSLDRTRLDLANLQVRPPAAEGDLYRAARERPRAIGLIDGYFEAQPAVWHKEILWAMSQGIHVFGAASMGALRAAELSPFGMIGIGVIFRAYRRGVLMDDGDVAVLHGPEELGYPSLTEALVNVRATLARAQAERVITIPGRRIAAASAARVFYKDRSWERLLADAVSAGLSSAEVSRLKQWLPRGRVDLKRRDAGQLIDALARRSGNLPTPVRPGFRFADTTYWRRVVQRQALESRPSDGPAPAG